MIVLPSGIGLNGFIHKYKFNIYPSSSSTNNNESRKWNPLTDSNDRWCSLDTGIGEWYKLDFVDSHLFITNYSIKNQFNSVPKSWFVEGFDGIVWHVISNVTESNFNAYETKLWRTENYGPFHSLRFTSTSSNYDGIYHFCFFKLELYGFTESFLKHHLTICQSNFSFHIPPLIFILLFSNT